MHPFACYFSLHDHPAHRGRGIGRTLLSELEGWNRERLPLQTAFWERSVHGVRFLQRAGFREVRRTYEPLLPVALVNGTAYGEFEARCREQGYVIRSLAALATEADRHRKLAALCSEVYQRTHRVNPVAPLTLAQWEELLLREPLVAEGSFVALHDGEYAGVSLLHPGDEAGVLALGWRGAAEAHRPWERDLVVTLTLQQVGHARSCGATCLRGELDSTDPGAMVQFELLPFGPAPAWVTYRRE